MIVKEPESIYKIRFNDCDPLGHLNNARYLDYMLNAREDHSIEYYNIDYLTEAQKTGSTWVAIQNQIAYLKEVRFNVNVLIQSKVIHCTNKTVTVEILMYNEKKTKIHAVLWITSIYFNMVKRAKQEHSESEMQKLNEMLVEIPEKTFEERVQNLRVLNKRLAE